MNPGASELEDVVPEATPAEEEEEMPHQEQSVKTRKKKPEGQKQLDGEHRCLNLSVIASFLQHRSALKWSLNLFYLFRSR